LSGWKQERDNVSHVTGETFNCFDVNVCKYWLYDEFSSWEGEKLKKRDISRQRHFETWLLEVVEKQQVMERSENVSDGTSET
jgi:hypothetical protein